MQTDESSDKKYRAVIFNLYGTLVDSNVDETQESAWTALRAALYDEGADYVTNERLREQFRRAKRKLSRLDDAGDDYAPDLLGAYEALFDELWIETDIELSRKVAWTFRKAATNRLELVPGALDMLRALKRSGRRVVLLSNSQACYTRPELRALGLDDIFDDIIIASDEGVSTSSGEIYERVLERLGMPASDVLMVSNDETCDVRGAREAGIDAILLDADLAGRIERHVERGEARDATVGGTGSPGDSSVGAGRDAGAGCAVGAGNGHSVEAHATHREAFDAVAKLTLEARLADAADEAALDADRGEFAAASKRPGTAAAKSVTGRGAAGGHDPETGHGAAPRTAKITSFDGSDYHELLDFILREGTGAVAMQ
ncbi:HAD family hydrolase [Bifidobacterium choloepi]|uniref:HAD family hydrolase n=1 Tax=Bifidobacterium choloepi TaxID=2614131 RepID=A0A6I5NDC8_9BIFI|nr:HAD family hydrolase [Bifidobacterium choloepi]NEG70550.1 HAD family hydrolase [Bifidobacterium choloepi]